MSEGLDTTELAGVTDGPDGGRDRSVSPGPDGRVRVGVADSAVVTEPAALTTSGLGSCLGVAVHDTGTPVGGLVHPMLPEHDAVAGGAPEKFVDTGVTELVEDVVAAGADRDRLVAKLAGGARMLSFSEDDIGGRNVAAAETILGDLGVPLVARRVGGDQGRSVRLDTETGTLTVRRGDEVARL